MQAALLHDICRQLLVDKFKKIHKKLRWKEARTQCKNHGGDLASITSREEQALFKEVISPFKGQLFFIGLTDAKEEGNFVSIDDASVSVMYWSGGEPNKAGSSGEDCVIAHYHGWLDFGCQRELKAVCKLFI